MCFMQATAAALVSGGIGSVQINGGTDGRAGARMQCGQLALLAVAGGSWCRGGVAGQGGDVGSEGLVA